VSPVVGFACADTAVMTRAIKSKAVCLIAERRPDALV
jgi:hypothetical protein